jgi:hypothetical protein
MFTVEFSSLKPLCDYRYASLTRTTRANTLPMQYQAGGYPGIYCDHLGFVQGDYFGIAYVLDTLPSLEKTY